MAFQVQKQRCSTCIYRKDMHFNLEQLENEVLDPYGSFRTFRACHPDRSGDTCCRGFWDKHKDEFTIGQLAQRLNCVAFVIVDNLEDLLW